MVNLGRWHVAMDDVGDIRARTSTDIGDEKQCITCGEYWPADTEFFEPKLKTHDRLSARCIACVKEGLWSSVLF